MVSVKKLAVPRHCFLLLLLLYLLYLLGNLAWQELLGGRQELLGGRQELLGGRQELLGGRPELLGGRQELLGGRQELLQQGGQELLLPHQGQVEAVASMASVEEGISEPAEPAWITNNTEVVLWIGEESSRQIWRLILTQYFFQ